MLLSQKTRERVCSAGQNPLVNSLSKLALFLLGFIIEDSHMYNQDYANFVFTQHFLLPYFMIISIFIEEERPMQMLFESASYQNFPNIAMSNQLTDVGRRVCWVTMNLLMYEEGDALYSVQCTCLSPIVSQHQPPYSYNGKKKYDVTNIYL